jgi:3-hydroxyisobutyrate dehydrogenase-like beta-hydroxyacid dehydrogenase
MSRSVGFIGLGMMGMPMSRNLLKAGFDLTVWNRTAEKATAVVEAGARSASSPRALAEACDVVIAMLTGPPETEAVMQASDGILTGLKAGATVIDMSTNAPEVSRRLSAAAAPQGSWPCARRGFGRPGFPAIAGLVRQIYAQAMTDGHGDDAFSAVAASAEARSAVKLSGG